MGSSLRERWANSSQATFGVGLVLVFLPACALFFGQNDFRQSPMIGLPIVAILGIMILFGSLALISTIFARLGLSNKDEALALPAGSIRAAIALSLVVLFCLISIMLHQSVADPYAIPGLTANQKNALLADPVNRVIAIIPEICASAPCTDQRYVVHLVQPQGREATDLAKQLLILVGTLMASVTSFYYGARTSSAAVTDGLTRLQEFGNMKDMREVNPGDITKPNIPD